MSLLAHVSPNLLVLLHEFTRCSFLSRGLHLDLWTSFAPLSSKKVIKRERAMAHMEGLPCRRASTGLEETRGGVLVYGGSAAGLQVAFQSATEKACDHGIEGRGASFPKLAEYLSLAIDGLKEALQFAKDLSEDEVPGEDAVDVSVKEVEKYVVAVKEEETKALFRAGARIVGPLWRQPNEPRTSPQTFDLSQVT